MTPDERDRLTRLETKQDILLETLKEQREALLIIIDRHTTQIEEHADFITGLKTKLAIVGAGFTLLGSVVMMGLQYALDALFGKGP